LIQSADIGWNIDSIIITHKIRLRDRESLLLLTAGPFTQSAIGVRLILRVFIPPQVRHGFTNLDMIAVALRDERLDER
jgi:hypothetical protein